MAGNGMPLDWYCGNAERALRELVAECNAHVLKAKDRVDELSKGLNERNQLLQDVDLVLADEPTKSTIAALRIRIAKLSKKGGRRRA